MRKKVYKLFANYEKEEAWLNEMAAQGWHCIHYIFGRYTFEQGEPGKFIYRIQLLEHPTNHSDSKAYLEFLDEAGIEHFSTYGGWIYLRKREKDGPFQLFSDNKSRITHYKRIIFMLLPLALINYLFASGILGKFRFVYLLNLGAALLLTFPIVSYYRRIKMLEKDSEIRE